MYPWSGWSFSHGTGCITVAAVIFWYGSCATKNCTPVLGHLPLLLHEEHRDIPDRCHEIKLVRRRLAEGQEPLNMLNRCYIKDVILGVWESAPTTGYLETGGMCSTTSNDCFKLWDCHFLMQILIKKSHGMHVEKWQPISGLICGCLFYEFSHFKKTLFVFLV